MAGEQVGERKSVSLTTVWPRELDFSGWLAGNIEFLDEQVNWELDPDSVLTEVSKGALRVDLLLDARAPGTGDRFPVVIENQLGTTDGRHLSRLMTYMVAFEARGAVWIAGGVRHEHVAVMQWLNDNAEIDAYLFKVEAVRIDDSRPIPILTRIVGPSTFLPGGPAGGPSEYKQKVRSWWGRVLPDLNGVHPAWHSRRPTVHPYPSVPIPGAPEALRWYVNVGARKSSLGIKILGGTLEESDYYFDRLKEREHLIRDVFGEEIAWEKGPGRTRWVRRKQREPIGFDDDPELQKRAAGAIAEVLRRFVVATEDLAGGIPVFSDRPADGDEIDDDG